MKFNENRAKKAIKKLHDKFYNGEGIFGIKNNEDVLSVLGIKRGSEKHLVWITLLSALDYSRNANKLWEAGKEIYADENKRWIFDIKNPNIKNYEKIKKELTTPAKDKELKIAQRTNKDPKVWQIITNSINEIMEGSITNFVTKGCNNDARILYFEIKNKYNKQFPYLSGNKILPMWIRLIHKYCNLNLENINEIPLPVDTHVARATHNLCSEINKEYKINDELREKINLFWEDIANDLNLEKLEFDELFFFLSKEGCSKSPKKCNECIVKKECNKYIEL